MAVWTDQIAIVFGKQTSFEADLSPAKRRHVWSIYLSATVQVASEYFITADMQFSYYVRSFTKDSRISFSSNKNALFQYSHILSSIPHSTVQSHISPNDNHQSHILPSKQNCCFSFILSGWPVRFIGSCVLKYVSAMWILYSVMAAEKKIGTNGVILRDRPHVNTTRRHVWKIRALSFVLECRTCVYTNISLQRE